MPQITPKLHRVQGGYQWFCAGCDRLHTISPNQAHGAELSDPTFPHTVRHTWKDETDPSVQHRCAYTITNGFVTYDPDCTHGHAGQTVPIPDLPKGA